MLGWLLEPSYPSVRYFALRKLLDHSADNRAVAEAKAAILKQGPAAETLALQRPDGSWQVEESAFSPMYRGTPWQLMYLAELAADGQDERIGHGVERVLATMQQGDGQFPTTGRTYHGLLMCCHASLTRALLRLGYAGDSRVDRAVAVVSKWVVDDGCLCRYNKGVPCSWAAVKALQALSEVPPARRSEGTVAATRQCAEFLANGDLARVHETQGSALSKHWFKFSFPRSYQSDILEATLAMDAAGYVGDSRLRPGVEYVAAQRRALKDEDGEVLYAWKSAHALTGKLLVDLDQHSGGGPSKWVTLLALTVLKDWTRRAG